MLTTRAQKDAENVKEIKALLPKLGIDHPSREAIIQLFEHVALKKRVDPDILQRWRQLGRLTEDNQIAMSSEHFDIELCLLSLQWDGRIERVPPRIA